MPQGAHHQTQNFHQALLAVLLVAVAFGLRWCSPVGSNRTIGQTAQSTEIQRPMAIADERYVSLTTWTTDGHPQHVPVWLVGLGGSRVGFTTGSGSWKVRRIRHNPAVELQACNRGGTVTEGSTAVSGTAEIVDGNAYREVRTAIRRKYGIQYVVISLAAKMADAVGRLRGRKPDGDCAVIVTLG